MDRLIICHSNRLKYAQITAAYDQLAREAGTAKVTAGKVYRHLGKPVECGGCMALATVLLAERNEAASAAVDTVAS